MLTLIVGILTINILCLNVAVLYLYNSRKDKPKNNSTIIVPSDAAGAVIHKALKHLIESCEDHMAVCPYKEGGLSGLIAFGKEALSRDMTTTGIMRMANLEERLSQYQEKYNELLKVVSDPTKLEQHLKKECLCGSTRQCQQHGTK